MDGKSFFQGIHYGDPVKDNGNYQVVVILTHLALKRTLKSLNKDIFRSIDTLSKKQQKSSLEKIVTLRSLLPYNTKKTT